MLLDRYMELSLSSQFHTTIPIDNGLFVESHENFTYTFSYPNHIFILDPTINIKLLELWNTMIMNTIFFVWIFYIAYFYQNLTRTQVAIAGRNISRAGSNINALAYLIELDIANHYF